MDVEYKKKFYNLKYGKCYLIDEKENLYLIYADKYFNHYIVCTYIEPKSNAMMNQEFFPTLEEAREYFKVKIKGLIFYERIILFTTSK